MNTFTERITRNAEGRGNGAWMAAVALVGGIVLAQGYPADARYGEEKAIEMAEDLGIENAKVVDVDRFAVGYSICGPLDSVKYEIEGTTARGDAISATVCKGLFNEASLYGGM